MIANGDGNKSIWITEFGWYADPNAADPVPAGGVTLTEQATYTSNFIQEVASSYPYVKAVMIYNGVDSDAPADPTYELYGASSSPISHPNPFTRPSPLFISPEGTPGSPRSERGCVRVNGVTSHPVPGGDIRDAGLVWIGASGSPDDARAIDRSPYTRAILTVFSFPEGGLHQ